MSVAKFQALADQVTGRRIKHLQKLKNVSRVRQVDSKNRNGQLPLFFKGRNAAIEVYKEFDPRARSVEWSYYSCEGTFLLQFGFSLEEQNYQIYSVHSSLFQCGTLWEEYLHLINENLSAHYPALRLVESLSQGPTLEIVGT